MENDIHTRDEMIKQFTEIMEALPDREQSFEQEQEQEPQTESDYFDEFQDSKQDFAKGNAPLMFDRQMSEENIVKWQLQVDWTRIEQIIRGYKPKTDEKGNEYFESIPNHYLNDNGVNEVLNILSFYLSKEIFLAAYKSEDTNIRVKQFAQEFNDYVFDNLDELGMDTKEKKKKAKMLVLNIVNLVDASYSRSIGGEERKSLRETIHISQTGQLNNPMRQEDHIMPQKRGIISRMLG